MRTTVTIDDKLFEDVLDYTGSADRSEAIRIALRKFVQYEAARELALLGGSMRGFSAAPRRRPPGYRNEQ